jgi:hypothetical protein
MLPSILRSAGKVQGPLGITAPTSDGDEQVVIPLSDGDDEGLVERVLAEFEGATIV